MELMVQPSTARRQAVLARLAWLLPVLILLAGCGRVAPAGQVSERAQGFYAAGQARWARARFDLTRAASDQEQAILREPKVSAPYARLAQVMDALGHPGTALALMQQALQLNPTSATYENDVGLLAVESRRWQVAAAAYGRARRQHPADWLALDGLALVAIHRHAWTSAGADLEAAQSLGGPQGETYDVWGRLLLAEAQPRAALSFFQDAHRVSPEWWQADYDVARAELALHQRAAAVRAAEAALRANPAAGPALTLLIGVGKS